MFFLCSMVVSYRCCPFAWTDNVTCLRNMLQDYVIPSSYCRRVLGTKLITHWFCRLFQIPQHDLILWVSPRHGQFLGSHCVETFIDTSAADSSTCAVGVVRTQLGHSGLHAKQKVMGLSGNDIIQHLIPMEFQLMTKLDFWDGGHKPFAAAPWTVDRTFFYQSGTGSSDSCARAGEWTRRSAMMSDGFFLGKKWNLMAFEGRFPAC